jgi:hypothetical protein
MLATCDLWQTVKQICSSNYLIFAEVQPES